MKFGQWWEEKRPSNCWSTRKYWCLMVPNYCLIFWLIFAFVRLKKIHSTIWLNKSLQATFNILSFLKSWRWYDLLISTSFGFLKKGKPWIPKFWQRKMKKFWKNMFNNNEVIMKGWNKCPLHHPHTLCNFLNRK